MSTNIFSRYRNAVTYRLWRLKNSRTYGSLGSSSLVASPIAIHGGENIFIGNSVRVGFHSWLAAQPLTGASSCRLEIGDGCAIGNFNHIYATRKIIIGKKVLTADKVYISDNQHEYRDINTAVIDQPIKQADDVYIGDGTWIGENVCIIGVSVGKQCVVGANAVVIKDVPDYCVVVGNPAKIIKRFNHDTNAWQKTDADGNFLT